MPVLTHRSGARGTALDGRSSQALRGDLLRARAWQLYLAAGALAAMLYLFVPTLGEKGPFFNLIGISSVVAIVAGVRLHRPARTLPWYLFAGGMFVFLVGDVF